MKNIYLEQQRQAETHMQPYMQPHMQSTHAPEAPAAAREFFETLPTHVLSARGRIMVDQHAPFCITSCSGLAAKLLNTSSMRLSGRRLQAIVQPADIAKLEQATRATLVPHQRAYLSIASPNQRQLHVIIQTCETMTGGQQIEVLLFPAQQEDSLFEEIVVDDIQSCARSRSGLLGSDSPDRDLALSEVGSDDDEVFAGIGTDWVSADLIGKLDNVCRLTAPAASSEASGN